MPSHPDGYSVGVRVCLDGSSSDGAGFRPGASELGGTHDSSAGFFEGTEVRLVNAGYRRPASPPSITSIPSTKWVFPMRRKEKVIVLKRPQRPRANRLAVGALFRRLLDSEPRLAAWLPRRGRFPRRMANG